MEKIKQVIEMPYEVYLTIVENNNKILAVLQNLNLVKNDEFILATEWMEICKVSRWTFDDCRKKGMKAKKIGRKFYVPKTEVDRFLNGEFKDKTKY